MYRKSNINTKVTFSRLRHKRLRLHIPDAANNFIPYEILPTNMGKRTVLKAKRLSQAMRLCANAPETVADKLRYARLSSGLLQDDLAALLGIDRATLLRYENGQVSEENMQVDVLLQVAAICGRDNYYCCNPYHVFIAEDAGKQIKRYRKGLGLTQAQFAEKIEVSLTTVKRWERNQNHQLNWWYAPALKGHITGQPLKRH